MTALTFLFTLPLPRTRTWSISVHGRWHWHRRHQGVLSHRRKAHSSCSMCASTPSSTERILWAEGLTKSHDGERHQFRDINLSVSRGSKIAILGANGSGKSTLLHVLSGALSPDKGSVSIRRDVELALVSQNLPVSFPIHTTVFSAVLHLAGKYTTSRRVHVALDFARASERVHDAMKEDAKSQAQAERQLTKATLAMEDVPGAWEVESYMRTVLEKLSLPVSALLSQLSGGQKRRVGIAAALVSKPTLLLLDEVTNHLSIEAIQFLEDTLSDPLLTVLCISHDRYFIDKVCTTALWDLDHGHLNKYGPGYASFLEQKAVQIESQRKHVSSLAKTFKKELEWIRKQPKARGTKAKSRIEHFEKLQITLKEKRAALNKSSVRALTSATTRLGNEIIRLENVTLCRGDTLILSDFSYTFQPGERIGICGGNGVGKSTVLKALMAQMPLEAGSISIGETVVFGHYDQNGIDLDIQLSEPAAAVLRSRAKGRDSEMRVIDFVNEIVSMFGTSSTKSSILSRGNASTTHVTATPEEMAAAAEARLDAKIAKLSYSSPLVSNRGTSGRAANANPIANLNPVALLDHFGFERSQQHSFVSRLSGGERRRLQLMSLLLRNPNVLLLDEVSNDLDIDTLSMLEDLLVAYSGVLVMVSHDRFMLDRLVDHLLILEGNGQVSLVEGKFTDYLAAKKEAEDEEKRVRAIRSAEKRSVDLTKGESVEQGQENLTTKRKKLSYREKREYEQIEGQIENEQRRLAEISKLLEEEATTAGYTELAAWTKEMATLGESIDKKLERWMELDEIAGG